MMKRWFEKKRAKAMMRTLITLSMFICICLAAAPSYASATGNSNVDSITEDEISANPDADDNTLDLNITSNAGSATLESTLQILILLTVLSLAPSILIMLTSFTRVIVVFHFLRTALGTQTTPPNQVLVGLALFITFAVMAPVFNEVNTNAVQPYMAGTIKQEAALEAGTAPLRTFMLKQTREKDLKLFMTINGQSSDDIENTDDISIMTIIPAFIISELRTAFIIGFIIYLPFIVIDMVVASTLMSMGMMMLPPTTISLPFKILLFVLADGWNLLIGQLVQSFQ
ncbi:MAG: flagellar type III secretion system pore protein FliP [Eubacteriales bacterium]|nr:flagellar type III secretion system pore protein FliP [Eubacteriales bacterium]